MMFLDTRAYLEQICDLTPSPHHTFVSSVGQAHKLLVAGLISYMHNKVCEEIKFASINIKKWINLINLNYNNIIMKLGGILGLWKIKKGQF